MRQNRMVSLVGHHQHHHLAFFLVTARTPDQFNLHLAYLPSLFDQPRHQTAPLLPVERRARFIIRLDVPSLRRVQPGENLAPLGRVQPAAHQIKEHPARCAPPLAVFDGHAALGLDLLRLGQRLARERLPLLPHNARDLLAGA